MEKAPERLVFLDLVRGSLALSVMGYHLAYYVHGYLFYNIGLYSVYGFFVLSGLSLHHAYKNKINDGIEWVVEFSRARIYRIFPLLLLVTIAWGVWILFEGKRVDGLRVITSMIGLFGFANPGVGSIAGGAWSIGIEIVYYFSFPILVALALSRRFLFGMIFLVAQVSYTNHVLPSQGSLVPHWVSYTQPLSFIFYFYVGIVVSIHRENIKKIFGQQASYFLFAAFSFAILLTPSSSPLEILTGLKGIFMIVCVSLIVVFAAVLRVPDKLKTTAEYMGNLSYGIYLWHSLILIILKHVGFTGIKLSVLVVILTFIVASITYYLIENPLKRFGRLKGCSYLTRSVT